MGEIETRLSDVIVSLAFVAGGSAGMEKANPCLFQCGPEEQPPQAMSTISMGSRHLIVWAVSPIREMGEAIY